MSLDTYIKDSDVRKYFRRDNDKLHGVYPDGCWLTDNADYVFEYENSSRGITTHVARYALIYKNKYHKTNKSLIVIIKRSTKHISRFNADYVNAKTVADMALDLYGMTTIFLECNDDIFDIAANIQKLTGLENVLSHHP